MATTNTSGSASSSRARRIVAASTAGERARRRATGIEDDLDRGEHPGPDSPAEQRERLRGLDVLRDRHHRARRELEPGGRQSRQCQKRARAGEHGHPVADDKSRQPRPRSRTEARGPVCATARQGSAHRSVRAVTTAPAAG